MKQYTNVVSAKSNTGRLQTDLPLLGTTTSKRTREYGLLLACDTHVVGKNLRYEVRMGECKGNPYFTSR